MPLFHKSEVLYLNVPLYNIPIVCLSGEKENQSVGILVLDYQWKLLKILSLLETDYNKIQKMYSHMLHEGMYSTWALL